jgi:hypothetical protein
MRIKQKCILCSFEEEKKVTFREWFQTKIGKDKIGDYHIFTCDDCTKALYKIGLARFSDIKRKKQQLQKLKNSQETKSDTGLSSKKTNSSPDILKEEK